LTLTYIRPTRVEINLDNLEYNLKRIRGITDPRSKICAVLKGNAYGHGAYEVAKYLMDYDDVYYLAVACLDEALELRENGITKPIIILGYTPEGQFGEVVKYDITQTIYSLQSAQVLAAEAQARGKNARIHVKLDTGMNRLGFVTDDTALKEIMELFELKGLTVEGLFTHFSKADEEDLAYTRMQFDRFSYISGKLSMLPTALQSCSTRLPTWIWYGQGLYSMAYILTAIPRAWLTLDLL
jgi:alanine racemase